MGSQTTVGNSQTIARNSIWYGIELGATILGSLLSSVIVARSVGPTRLAYFNYVMWLTSITVSVGCLGIPATARKYIAEYLNRGEPGVARSTYLFALRLQWWICFAVTALGLVLVLAFGEADYRAASLLLVLAIAPRMLGWVPSQANNAAEELRRNTLPALTGATLTIVLSIFSIWVGWELIGVAAAMLIGASVETVLKFRAVESWMGLVQPEPISTERRKRMVTYSGHSLLLMMLNIVVWDRSDMLFLKWLDPDVKQVAFFSLAFNLTERILLIPQTFLGSIGTTMLAQYGRGEEKLRDLAVVGARFALLIALPLLAGIACVANPLMVLVYREPFRPTGPVLSVAALFAIPKALNTATALLQANERQGFLVAYGCICGAIDIALDILLIPHYGAVGAAIANGVGQSLAVLGTWWYATKVLQLDLRLSEFGRILAAGMVMVGGVLAINSWVNGYFGMVVSIVAGAVIYFAAVRAFGALSNTDVDRLLAAGKVLPSSVRPYFGRALVLLSRRAVAAV